MPYLFLASAALIVSCVSPEASPKASGGSVPAGARSSAVDAWVGRLPDAPEKALCVVICSNSRLFFAGKTCKRAGRGGLGHYVRYKREGNRFLLDWEDVPELTLEVSDPAHARLSVMEFANIPLEKVAGDPLLCRRLVGIENPDHLYFQFGLEAIEKRGDTIELVRYQSMSPDQVPDGVKVSGVLGRQPIEAARFARIWASISGFDFGPYEGLGDDDFEEIPPQPNDSTSNWRFRLAVNDRTILEGWGPGGWGLRDKDLRDRLLGLVEAIKNEIDE